MTEHGNWPVDLLVYSILGYVGANGRDKVECGNRRHVNCKRQQRSSALTQHYQLSDAELCKLSISGVMVKAVYAFGSCELALLVGEKCLIFRLARVEPGEGQANYQYKRRGIQEIRSPPRRGEERRGLWWLETGLANSKAPTSYS